jgi:hypothetical protein
MINCTRAATLRRPGQCVVPARHAPQDRYSGKSRSWQESGRHHGRPPA